MRGLTLSRPAKGDSSAALTPGDADLHAVLDAKTSPLAFAPLYRCYFDPIYRYCYRRLGHHEAAEDATSQIFAKALAALPGYREEAPSFRSWLFAIAHNVLIDESRMRRPTEPLDSTSGLPAQGPSTEEHVLSSEAGRTIRALLAQLSPDQREVLELRLAGLTGPEIAATVGRSLGSVKIAQVRAFARMRTALGLVADPAEEARRDER